MQDIQKWVGIRIRALREQKNLSQEALADLCGINRSHMGKIERGEVNLGVATLFSITLKLGVTMTAFFKGLSNE
ncbi:MAG: transcriptional regulator [Candidatus Angelobacter sp. Gp1-AA117]|nr:MAG: transcriptional regulator [Candidatus Angelobacter sp. Gp1-AA117]